MQIISRSRYFVFSYSAFRNKTWGVDFSRGGIFPVSENFPGGHIFAEKSAGRPGDGFFPSAKIFRGVKNESMYRSSTGGWIFPVSEKFPRGNFFAKKMLAARGVDFFCQREFTGGVIITECGVNMYEQF